MVLLWTFPPISVPNGEVKLSEPFRWRPLSEPSEVFSLSVDVVSRLEDDGVTARVV